MSGDCERLREVAAELALGIADGEERARALDHLDGCAECRAQLERLSTLADELLLLAPAAEPPAGFEDRVTEAMEPRPRRMTLARRLVVPALAALAAATVAGVAIWAALADDRDLADSYRETLAVANGEYFDAAPLEAPGGEKIGYVYGYQGRSSWVLAVVYDGVPAGVYELDLVTDDGRHRPLRELTVVGEDGSAGGVTPVPYSEVAEVRLLDGDGREVAESRLRE